MSRKAHRVFMQHSCSAQAGVWGIMGKDFERIHKDNHLAAQAYTKLVMPRGHRRRNRILRMIRAAWRDTRALFNEFRAPIVLFILVTVGGGWLYGELHVMAGHGRIPFIDLPYIMTALMILETPIDVPREPYLIAFWYLLPPIAIYILGRGATEFVRLFFNRSERRDAWEEAVASTYRNHAIVLGLGHVGYGVVKNLVELGADVVVIDNSLSAEQDRELSVLGVPAIVGDGRQSLTLEKAGIQSADALIVCTSNDHVNLEVIMRARDMNPTLRIVARIWDDQFSNQIKQFMGVSAIVSSAKLAAPVFAGAAMGLEITQTMTIHGKEYSTVSLKVNKGSFFDGRTIEDVQHDERVDIVLHGSGEEVVVRPGGHIRVRAGDTLVIFAEHNRILALARRNRPRG